MAAVGILRIFMVVVSLVPRLSDHAEELYSGEEPGLYCERKWLRNYSERQVLTLHDACSLIYELVTS